MDAIRKSDIIAALNTALQAELEAVKNYSAHARAIADPEVNLGLRNILEVEEGHARALASRIGALGGHATTVESIASPYQDDVAGDLVAVAEMLRSDLADEQWAIKHYAATIADFFPLVDEETLAVLEENLIDELRHARWLRDQVRHLA
jgi:bacterioferritin (cytochrome b1)